MNKVEGHLTEHLWMAVSHDVDEPHGKVKFHFWSENCNTDGARPCFHSIQEPVTITDGGVGSQADLKKMNTVSKTHNSHRLHQFSILQF